MGAANGEGMKGVAAMGIANGDGLAVSLLGALQMDRFRQCRCCRRYSWRGFGGVTAVDAAIDIKSNSWCACEVMGGAHSREAEVGALVM